MASSVMALTYVWTEQVSSVGLSWAQRTQGVKEMNAPWEKQRLCLLDGV